MSAVTRLDEHCTIIMGQAPGGDAYNNDGHGWPLIAGAGDFSGDAPAPKKFTTEASKLSQAGDIILGIRASIGDKVLADGEYCIGRGVAALRPGNQVDSRFLWHWLTLNTPTLAAKGKGATFKQVNREDIGGLPIRLPALDEQQRVAQVLDKVDALRAKRREAIALLDDLARSIFLDMFGDVVGNNRGWPTGKVSDLVYEFQSGKSFASDFDGPEAAGIRILKVSSVTSGWFRGSESKPVPAGYVPPDSHMVREGDLLFSRANTAALIGAVALAGSTSEKLILPDKIWRFEWHVDKPANKYFIRELFRQEKFREEISKRASGTSGSMKNISQGKVLSIPCALIPLDLQNAFGERVQAIERLRSGHVRHLAQLDALFASLQHRAFNGTLFPADSAA